MTFIEQGPGVHRVIGTTTHAQRVLHFTPNPDAGAARKIVALIDRDGMPARSVDVARFRSQPVRPGRPGRMRAVHRRGVVTLSWAGARGAATYAVTMRLSNGRRLLFLTRRRILRVRGITPEVRGTVRVFGRSKAGRFGPARSAAFRAQPRPRHRVISA